MNKERDTQTHWEQLRRRASEILVVRSEVTKRQTRPADIVERIGHFLADPRFFLAVASAHLLWVVLNLPIYPWFQPWDPYPFMFLATFASAEAPFIALLVLMYQRRSDRISELRDEVDLQLALRLTREATMMLRLIKEVQDRLEIASREDEALVRHLQQEIDPKELLYGLRERLKREEDDTAATAP